jgi:hypothetical protein
MPGIRPASGHAGCALTTKLSGTRNKLDVKWYIRHWYETFVAFGSSQEEYSQKSCIRKSWGCLVSVHSCLCSSRQSSSTFRATLARSRSCLASKFAFPFPVIRTSARKAPSTKSEHRRWCWLFGIPRRCQRFSGPSLRFIGTFRTLITITFISERVIFQIRVLALQHMEL